MNINFIVNNMGFLRYFMPLVIEANKRNISSKLFMVKSTKYCNCHKYLNDLKSLSEQYNFGLHEAEKINKFPSQVTFVVEGRSAKKIKYDTLKISLVCLFDFLFF